MLLETECHRIAATIYVLKRRQDQGWDALAPFLTIGKLCTFRFRLEERRRTLGSKFLLVKMRVNDHEAVC